MENTTAKPATNLRDRIAAVICDMDALHAKQWSLDVADALIEALGLKQEVRYGEPKAYTVDSKSTRYVTEWKNR